MEALRQPTSDTTKGVEFAELFHSLGHAVEAERVAEGDDGLDDEEELRPAPRGAETKDRSIFSTSTGNLRR